MALRRLVTQAIFPSLERDLGAAIGREMAAVDDMLNNMLAPQVFGYDRPTSSSGVFGATQPRQAWRDDAAVVVKINYPVKHQGLFDE